MQHIPVLLEESVKGLITNTSGVYFEATAGFGGHSQKILDQLDPNGLLIATDVDENAYAAVKARFARDSRFKCYRFNFSQIDIIAKLESLNSFTGVFADLGVSSFQIDDPEAGFTFRTDTPLDLRMDRSIPLTAAQVVNEFEQNEITDILFRFGEEKNSRKIAEKIVAAREKKKFQSTADLQDLLAALVPPNYLRKTLARVFQALRIYINKELEQLEIFLEKSLDLLAPGGRLAVISYHSLEDRIVKEFFRNAAKDCVCPPDFPVCVCSTTPTLRIIVKKPITPSVDEVKNNPRARSGKLRIAEKL